MTNWSHDTDAVTDITHPLQHPQHSLNVDHDTRKHHAMNGYGIVSRNDVALDHKGKSMPWAPVQLYYPEHPAPGPAAGEQRSAWGTVEHSVEWNVYQYAPDQSRYVTPNVGRIGGMIFSPGYEHSK